MKIAIVGGGIYGVTAAIYLAKNNLDVTIFEKEKDIMMAASFVNQYRAHRGYHYPRSKETILSCSLSEPEFKREYADAIISKNQHYYLIAKESSFLNSSQCLDVWKKFNLEHEEAYLDIINNEKIEKCLSVNETLIDPQKWKKICWERLKKYKVNVLLNTEAKEPYLKDYDFVIIATYAFNNALIREFPEKMIDYQFELIEKPLLKLPAKYKNKSMVVIDGPFMCIDPYGDTGLFLMGNVVHAIHKRNIGKYPEIPKEFLSILNKGIIKNPSITNISKFLDSAEEFFPGIKNEAEHVGSMYTVRTVLPYREHDDSRPTLITKINDRRISVFSGKIPVCVDTAKEILKIVQNIHLSALNTTATLAINYPSFN
jgi:hypothetical protein